MCDKDLEINVIDKCAEATFSFLIAHLKCQKETVPTQRLSVFLSPTRVRVRGPFRGKKCTVWRNFKYRNNE